MSDMPEYSTASPTNQTRSNRPKWLLLKIFLLVIGFMLLSSGAYYFYQNQKLLPSNLSDEAELAKVVKQVGKLIDLPSDETPVLATVTDKDKINSQAFFARAENGDIVLLYTNSGKAILYRPSTNRIVDVTLISTTNVDSDVLADTPQTASDQPLSATANPTVTTQPSPSPTSAETSVALLNGTLISGLANQSETKLIAAVPNLNIIRKTNAAQQNYAATRVIAVATSSAQVANAIAAFYNTQVTSQVPDGESASGSDVLVILGGDARPVE